MEKLKNCINKVFQFFWPPELWPDLWIDKPPYLINPSFDLIEVAAQVEIRPDIKISEDEIAERLAYQLAPFIQKHLEVVREDLPFSMSQYGLRKRFAIGRIFLGVRRGGQ